MFDLVLLAAITAFFKERLGLKGSYVILAAFLVGLFIWLSPQIGLAFPNAAPWINGVIDFAKFYLGAMGGVDLAVYVKNKPMLKK